MITTGCLMLMALVNYVSPLPVSKGDNEDIMVMKCIVEVIADALSRPHPLPVSQQCLDILRTDERLISILRHQNFLKELQDIAVEGARERAQLTESQAGMTGQVTKLPQDAPDELEVNPDRSMLLAGKKPGEKRGAEEEDREEEPEREATESQESREGNEIEGQEQVRSQEEQNPSNYISDSMNQKNQSEEKEGEMAENEKEEEKKQTSSEEEEEEEEEEEAVAHNEKMSGGKGETSEAKPSTEEEEEEEEKKRKASDSTEVDRKKKQMEGELSTEKEEEEEEKEEKRGVGAKRWSGMTHKPHGLQAQRRAPVEQEEALAEEEEEEEERRSNENKQPQEMPHHSKEVAFEEEEEDASLGVKRSPEERELRMMAKREPDDRRDEEGSATRKTEEPEIESLAAIESELENVAQKLHDLRRG